MKKLFQRTLAITGITLAIMGCSSEEDNIVMSPLPEVQSEFTPTTVWSNSVGSGVGQFFSKLAPAYDGIDKIFVASRDGDVKAINSDTGETVWDIEIESKGPARLAGGITAALDKMVIGSENGMVYAISNDDGSILWQQKVDGEIVSKPLIDSGLVVVNTSKGSLVGLSELDGSQMWEINNDVPNLTLRGESSPVTVAGGVFWGMSNGRLGAAILERGQVLWQQPIGTPKGATEIDRIVDVDSTPLIVDSTLFTVGINGQLVAVDLRSGQPMWKRPYSSALDLASDGSDVFVVTDKDRVAAVDMRSGTELWSNKKLEYRQLTAPTVINNYVVVGDTEGYLHWMDPYSGDFVAQQLIEKDGIAVPPLVLSDGYVVVTRDGSVKKMAIE
ncbi:MAG: outer membrane protein assembly factor BamB [Vibrio sp.]